MTFRLKTLTGHYFILKFDLSWGIRTNMGKPEGIFLNLPCDCHRVGSIFIKLIKTAYQFHHLAARFDSARNKWSLPQ